MYTHDLCTQMGFYMQARGTDMVKPGGKGAVAMPLQNKVGFLGVAHRGRGTCWLQGDVRYIAKSRGFAGACINSVVFLIAVDVQRRSRRRRQRQRQIGRAHV